MWKQDLQIGNKEEELTLPYLERYIHGSRAWINTLSPFITDIWWQLPDSKPLKVEVKFDVESQFTGNVALENKAIGGSTSSYLVYVLPTPPLPSLRLLMPMRQAQEMLDPDTTVTGGDQAHKLTLIRTQTFIRQSIILK